MAGEEGHLLGTQTVDAEKPGRRGSGGDCNNRASPGSEGDLALALIGRTTRFAEMVGFDHWVPGAGHPLRRSVRTDTPTTAARHPVLSRNPSPAAAAGDNGPAFFKWAVISAENMSHSSRLEARDQLPRRSGMFV